jgi:lipoprotein-releasing system permease protein
MPIIGALLDGAALPVAVEPLQVIGIALAAMAIALLSALSFMARCRHSTR